MSGEESTRTPNATIFVSDPSAEAERISSTLRSSGYTVVDVPLSMLVARVAVQRPRVILVDADADGALDAVARMRELPDADDIDVLFLARVGGALSNAEDALAHEGSGYFPRPVDVPGLVKKIEALTGGAKERQRASAPPPSIPSARMSATSLPPASMRRESQSSRPPPRSNMPLGTASQRPSLEQLAGEVSKRPVGVSAPLSTELEQLLAEAEQRVPVQANPESVPPTPEEEIEAVLPAELLEALDEPLDEEEDDDADVGQPPATRAVRPGTGPGPVTGAGGTSSGGTGAGTTGTGRRVSPGLPNTPAPVKTHGGTHSGHTSSSSTTGAGSEPRAVAYTALRGTSQPPPTAFSQPEKPAPPSVIAGAIAPGEGPRLVARAIASRATGALAFDADGISRRVVLREGDLITAASSVDSESLVAFLGERGELPRDSVKRIAEKFPAFGRHAGAALVAHGYLRQDQLWPILRGHAEWILGRMMQTERGTATHEAEAAGRLKSEPGVFGGSTGAEVFVEVLRRVVSPAEAIERMGGGASRVADGENASLLGECALGAGEREIMQNARGRSITELAQAAPGSDIATVIYALALLGVVEILRGVGDVRSVHPPAIDALDEEAVRARVRARLLLVEEGDYFAVLGVPRNATGYEVRRAFLELRREFEPSRILTPALGDLVDDVRKIAIVLEEAYEILKDGARRERYRRAIDASPQI